MLRRLEFSHVELDLPCPGGQLHFLCPYRLERIVNRADEGTRISKVAPEIAYEVEIEEGAETAATGRLPFVPTHLLHACVRHRMT